MRMRKSFSKDSGLTRWGLRNRLGKRNGQSIRINANRQLDALALSLGRRHDESNTPGFQFLISLIDIFNVETNRTTAGLLGGVSGRRGCWGNATTVERQRSGSGLKLSPIGRLKLQRYSQFV